jgi:ssDNA-binding Zn-finger/Zn-ribbon topoisomerase 1
MATINYNEVIDGQIEVTCEKCGHRFTRSTSQMTYIDGNVYPPGYNVSWYSDYEAECPECGAKTRVPIEG